VTTPCTCCMFNFLSLLVMCQQALCPQCVLLDQYGMPLQPDQNKTLWFLQFDPMKLHQPETLTRWDSLRLMSRASLAALWKW
jgi:hypothetical protein